MFRPLTIAALILGGWLGMKFERSFEDGRCRAAGGVVDASGLCRGLPLR